MESQKSEEYSDVSCIEQWLERRGWSFDLPEEEQERLEKGFGDEYGKVRSAMWERHYESLNRAEQALLDTGAHPSFSSDRAAVAENYLTEFRKFAKADFVARIEMSPYHGNTIVFTAWLTRHLSWREYRKVIPEFFRGFQVFVVLLHGTPPYTE